MCYLYLNKAENFLNTKEKKEEGKRDLSGKIKMLYILIQVKVTRMYVFVKSVPGFPGGSDGKESVCNSGDLGWKDSLEEGMATPSSILAWRIFMDRGAWRATVHGVAKSQTQLSD